MNIEKLHVESVLYNCACSHGLQTDHMVALDEQSSDDRIDLLLIKPLFPVGNQTCVKVLCQTDKNNLLDLDRDHVMKDVS